MSPLQTIEQADLIGYYQHHDVSGLDAQGPDSGQMPSVAAVTHVLGSDCQNAFGAGSMARSWHPWTQISGELEHDDPLYPDFVEYTANTNPLAYLVPGTDDPEWVTPYDER